MSFFPDEARDLATTFPDTERAEEAGVTYFRIPDVTLPDGCSPSPMTLLLCPSHLGGYEYRLFFAERVKTPVAKNWNGSIHILGQTWHAFSWQAKEKVTLTQIVGPPAEGVDMPITIQLPRGLYHEVLADLRRPHAHAAERIGFLYGQLATGGEPLVVITRYVSVPDEQYVVDDTVGARINGDAIRAAMQGVLDTGDGVFHTHLHKWPGTPWFSRTDDAELPRLIPAFRAVGPTQATGLFLLSTDSAIADVWLPGASGPERAAKISIVG